MATLSQVCVLPQPIFLWTSPFSHWLKMKSGTSVRLSWSDPFLLIHRFCRSVLKSLPTVMLRMSRSGVLLINSPQPWAAVYHEQPVCHGYTLIAWMWLSSVCCELVPQSEGTWRICGVTKRRVSNLFIRKAVKIWPLCGMGFKGENFPWAICLSIFLISAWAWRVSSIH